MQYIAHRTYIITCYYNDSKFIPRLLRTYRCSIIVSNTSKSYK
jgi:hypothetical protein